MSDSLAERDPITYREATTLFASKADIAEIKAALGQIDVKLERIVPREEHALRNSIVDERFKTWAEDLADLQKELRDLQSRQLPQWAVAILGPIASWLVTYFYFFVRGH